MSLWFWAAFSPFGLYFVFIAIKTALQAGVMLWRTAMILASEVSNRASKAIVDGIVTGAALGTFFAGQQITRAFAPASRAVKDAREKKARVEQGDAWDQMCREPENKIQMAIDILGLPKGFSAEDLSSRYREMALRNHEDKGGSKYIMQQVNWARDVLEGEV